MLFPVKQSVFLSINNCYQANSNKQLDSNKSEYPFAKEGKGFLQKADVSVKCPRIYYKQKWVKNMEKTLAELSEHRAKERPYSPQNGC